MQTVDASHSNVIDIDGSEFSPDGQREFFAENGFALVPGALTVDEVDGLLRQIEANSFHWFEEDLWDLPEFIDLIHNSPVLRALRNLLGDDLRFFKGAYLSAPPGRPAQDLHLDQGTASFEGDPRNSCASWINVGFYLTDLTPERAPLWVVPGSNKRYHLVPGSDLAHLQDEAQMVLARAGDAVLFHRSTVHAGGANTSHETRHGVFFSYRPAWAKPTAPVPEWPEKLVRAVPSEFRSLVTGLNDGF